MKLYKGVRKCLGGIVKVLFRIHIHGNENEPMEGGYLAVSNHISFVDVITSAVALKRPIRFMAKKELFGIPLLGSLIKALGAFPVDRKGNPATPIKKAIAFLQSGEVVGMFPTGHRFAGVKFDITKDEMKGGAAMACYRSKCRVLPIFISTKNDRVALFRRIDIYVGKPIEFEEFGFEKGGNDEYMRAAGVMYERIAELMPMERRS